MRSLFVFLLPLLTLASDLSLLPRQQPGTPQYDCHVACGSVIQLARTENSCTTTNFTASLSSCLSCALTYDIWQYYSESVAAAATECNLSAIPIAANTTTSTSPGSPASSATPTGSASRNTDITQTSTLSETQTSMDATPSTSPSESAAGASETAGAALRPGANGMAAAVCVLGWLIV